MVLLMKKFLIAKEKYLYRDKQLTFSLSRLDPNKRIDLLLKSINHLSLKKIHIKLI